MGTYVPSRGREDEALCLRSPGRLPEVVTGLQQSYPNVRLDTGTRGTCTYCGRTIDGEPGSKTGPTRGHLRPRVVGSFGKRFNSLAYARLRHDPELPHRHARFWVDQCRNCNKRQGALTVRQYAVWAAKATSLGPAVERAMAAFRAAGLLENDF